MMSSHLSAIQSVNFNHRVDVKKQQGIGVDEGHKGLWYRERLGRARPHRDRI